jgi:hypothetical protein
MSHRPETNPAQTEKSLTWIIPAAKQEDYQQACNQLGYGFVPDPKKPVHFTISNPTGWPDLNQIIKLVYPNLT